MCYPHRFSVTKAGHMTRVPTGRYVEYTDYEKQSQRIAVLERDLAASISYCCPSCEVHEDIVARCKDAERERDALRSRLEAAEARVERYREVLSEFAEVSLSDTINDIALVRKRARAALTDAPAGSGGGE